MKDEAYWTRSHRGHGSELIGCLHAQDFQILSQTWQPSQNTALCSHSSLMVSLYVLHSENKAHGGNISAGSK